MIGKSRSRSILVPAFVVTAMTAIAACVDLFHATEFAALCMDDAAACAVEGGTLARDVDAPETTTEETTSIDLCASGRTEARQRAERACGYLGACLGTVSGSTFGECMIHALAAYDCSFNPSLRPRGKSAVLWDCLSNVDSCDAVASCVFGTPAPPCTPHNGTYTACNLEVDSTGAVTAGPVVVECGNSTFAIGMEPCVLSGRTCAKVDDGKSICAGAQGATCTGTPRCDGTFAVQCRSAGGVDSDEGKNCELFGEGRCVRDDAGVACAPVFTSPTCSKTAKVVCNDAGTAAESCVDRMMVTINCASIGQRCNAKGVLPVDPIAACTNADIFYACVDGEEKCEQETLRSCARGTWFNLRCTSVPGLGACATSLRGRAACTVL